MLDLHGERKTLVPYFVGVEKSLVINSCVAEGFNLQFLLSIMGYIRVGG